MRRTGMTVTRALLSLLLLLPVAAGAVYSTVTDTDLTTAGSPRPDDGRESNGTGVAVSSATGSADLVAVRRAAGEADTQAGFLVTGTRELTVGAGELADGSKRLSEGAAKAAEGAQQLTDGLVKLQAGTGQLGVGATQVADGVARAVEQIEAMPLARDQLLGVLDELDATLATSKHPESPRLRMELVKLRVEVVNFRVDPQMLGQLNELRSGSRQVAEQLSTPGQPFHDGVYSAVTGSRSLSDGLHELDEGSRALQSGADELRAGAERIRTMAEANENKVNAIHAGLTSGRTGSPGNSPTDVGNSIDTGMNPMNALFTAILVWLAATCLWLVGKPVPRRVGNSSGTTSGTAFRVVFSAPVTAILGVAVTGAAFVATAARPSDSVLLGAVLLVVTLTAVAGSILGRALMTLLGPMTGRIVLITGLAAQVGVLGHVWSNTVNGAEVSTFWRVLTALTPSGYPAAALSELGSGTAGPVLWVTVAVLGALVVFGAVIIARIGPVADTAPESAPGSGVPEGCAGLVPSEEQATSFGTTGG
ncbi:hypothetical protein [Corynebacterium sp. CCM 9204]|uniref:hypothetical protein n=1 Tax=Corynebacterium sp. CCM 9204 TaxID=3057616 RepID=UPI003524947E